jgi:putative nucleotidyltransferase with HDIG domain
MAHTPNQPAPIGKSNTHQLMKALNSLAAELQNATHGEEKIYQVLKNELDRLGLRGGISELDSKKEALQFKSVAVPAPLHRMLKHFEDESRSTTIGYTVALEKVALYQRVAREGKAFFVADTSAILAQVIPDCIKKQTGPLIALLGRKPGIYAPLIYAGEVRGMLNIVGADLTEADLPTLQAIANHVAVALENARLIEKLEHTNQNLEAAYEKTLEGWVKALDLRDSVTEGHTIRTAAATVDLARLMGVPEDDLPHVRRGALLHDIGKMAIPDCILCKPDHLSETEWDVMKQHPKTAQTWLSGIKYLIPAIDIPYCHHEHWNGSGYVQGLSKYEIPFWARIFSVVDVWDAMTSDRPYRKALPVGQTLQYIRQEAGRLFDPQVVEAFFDLRAQNAAVPGD